MRTFLKIIHFIGFLITFISSLIIGSITEQFILMQSIFIAGVLGLHVRFYWTRGKTTLTDMPVFDDRSMFSSVLLLLMITGFIFGASNGLPELIIGLIAGIAAAFYYRTYISFKVRYTKVFHIIVGIICSLVGFFQGLQAAFVMGGIIGIISGFLLGYLWVVLTLRYATQILFVRICLGTIYGIISGITCGILVNVPGILKIIPVESILRGRNPLTTGISYGFTTALPLAVIGACVIAGVYRKKKQQKYTDPL